MASRSLLPGSTSEEDVMRLPRVNFTVRLSMCVVLCIAIGLAALRSSSFQWLRTVNTLVVALLFTAVLAAKQFRGTRAAFWFGFAVLGCGYYFLAFGPTDCWHLYDYEGGVDSVVPEVKPNLLTTDLVWEMSLGITSFPPQGGLGLNGSFNDVFIRSSWIGHLLLTPIIACFGGIASWVLALRRERGERAEPGT
jgi:hypothetical protein